MKKLKSYMNQSKITTEIARGHGYNVINDREMEESYREMLEETGHAYECARCGATFRTIGELHAHRMNDRCRLSIVADFAWRFAVLAVFFLAVIFCNAI